MVGRVSVWINGVALTESEVEDRRGCAVLLMESVSDVSIVKTLNEEITEEIVDETLTTIGIVLCNEASIEGRTEEASGVETSFIIHVVDEASIVKIVDDNSITVTGIVDEDSVI